MHFTANPTGFLNVIFSLSSRRVVLTHKGVNVTNSKSLNLEIHSLRLTVLTCKIYNRKQKIFKIKPPFARKQKYFLCHPLTDKPNTRAYIYT